MLKPALNTPTNFGVDHARNFPILFQRVLNHSFFSPFCFSRPCLRALLSILTVEITED
jgi:hypothetical protein